MANYFIGGITWTPVDLTPSNRGGNRRTKVKEVRITMKKHKDTGKLMASQTTISYPLIEEIGWKAGTKVRLMKAFKGDGKLLLLMPERSAIANQEVRPSSKGPDAKAAYKVGGVELARTIHMLGQAEVFEAWVEGNGIAFKPKEQTE